MIALHSRGKRTSRAALFCFGAAAVLALMSGCAATEKPGSESAAGEPRVVRQIDLPLLPAAGNDGERVFRGRGVSGSLTASGQWRVRGEVVHSRLRCATYQWGLRFGSGDASCTDVDWRTDVELLQSRVQCNNATLIHTGEGAVDLPPKQLGELNCVRATVRCSGACG